MKYQLWLALAIVVLGGGALGGEYLFVKFYPRHQQRVAEEALKLLPYRNDDLGIEMEVAAGIYGKVESFAGGVRIYRSSFWEVGPSLTVTSRPNPDKAPDFSPQIEAVWQTDGVTQGIHPYTFEPTKINTRNAVLIKRPKNRSMVLTAHIISPDRILEAECSAGDAEHDLFMQACDESVRTIKVAGTETPAPALPGVAEVPTSP